MELMPGGDLFSRLQAEMPGGRGRMFAWQNKGRRVALSVASAIAHLHHHRVCHFDVKSKVRLAALLCRMVRVPCPCCMLLPALTLELYSRLHSIVPP